MNLDFNIFRLRVPKGIDDGFSADAVNFIPNHRMQRVGVSLNQDTKGGRLIEGEFP
jgi:hypothetical protein